MTKIKPRSGCFTTQIEDEVTTQEFFDLMNYDSSRFKKVRVVFRVSTDMHNAMIKLQEAGVFWVSKAEMYRGLIGAGLTAQANQRGVCRPKVKAINDTCKGKRIDSNMKKLDDGLGHLVKSAKTEKKMEGIIKRYGDNVYGSRLNQFLGKWGEPIQGGSSKVVVKPHIIKRCEDAIAEIDVNSVFYIKKEKGLENPRIDIKIPMPLTVIAFTLKENYKTPKTLSEVYRAAFTIGLEIICNWIIQNRIPEEEYNFCKIIHNIYDYLTDDYG
jgi:hypothetical protein